MNILDMFDFLKKLSFTCSICKEKFTANRYRQKLKNFNCIFDLWDMYILVTHNYHISNEINRLSVYSE